jgi:hypothetical protein
MSAETPARPSRAHWIVWLFASVGLAGVLAFIFLVAMVSGPYADLQPAKVAGKTPDETYTVGRVQPVPGTDLLQMEIATSRTVGGSYASREGDVRNILLLDRRTGASRRILPDNRRRISQSRFLPAQSELGEAAGDRDVLAGEPEMADDRRHPAAYYLLLVDQPGKREIEDVLVGRLADSRQGFVMTGIDGIDSVWMDGPTRLGLIVRERLRLYYRIVDIPSLKVVENRPIVID